MLFRIGTITILFYKAMCTSSHVPEISITGIITDGCNPIERGGCGCEEHIQKVKRPSSRMPQDADDAKWIA